MVSLSLLAVISTVLIALMGGFRARVGPTIVWPETGTDVSLRFHAPANLLDSSVAFDPRTPDYPEFTVERSSVGRLIARRSDLTGTTQMLSRGIDSVEFERASQRSIKFTLTSTHSVRGAVGKPKTLTEVSVNRVLIHADQ